MLYWNTNNICVVLVICICSLLQIAAGVCDSHLQSQVCESCPSVILSQECCHDDSALAICNFCSVHPALCDNIDEILMELASDTSSSMYRDELLGEPADKRDGEYHDQDIYPPQRRAKYFLGKRSSSSLTDLYNQLEKRSSRPFLGKRGGLRPFLGKRLDEEYEKRGLRPFLGKRDTSFILAAPDAELEDLEDDTDKRGLRPFLGKRDDTDAKRFLVDGSDDLDEKRASRPFLGKRSNEEDDKRASRPFLGKRDSEGDDDKRASRPFLGKRDDEVDTVDKRGVRPFLGKRGLRPFLGKRTQLDHLYSDDYSDDSTKRASRPFLGKRDPSQLYEQPFARRAKYFLGKRSDHPSKRPKYFLGKRTENTDILRSLRPQTNKRPKYFLGKRSAS